MEQCIFKIDKIIEIFKKEFQPILNKFEIIQVLRGKPFTSMNIVEAKDKNNLIWHPGVYVFYGNERVWKVGRHLTNSRKRANQHINDNTHTEKYSIKDLEKITDAELILFNIIKQEDYHWVAAVEIYLEEKLKPLIPSKRTG